MKSVDCKHERASIKCPDCGIDFVGKMTMSSVEPSPELCVLTDGVIHCRCGHPSSHYGTMGARGAREVREVSVAMPTAPLTCDGACRYPDVGKFIHDPNCSMHGVKPSGLAAQIEDARKRIEAWPDDVRVAMGLPPKPGPVCGRPTEGHSIGTCTKPYGHKNHCWFPNMWNDM